MLVSFSRLFRCNFTFLFKSLSVISNHPQYNFQELIAKQQQKNIYWREAKLRQTWSRFMCMQIHHLALSEEKEKRRKKMKKKENCILLSFFSPPFNIFFCLSTALESMEIVDKMQKKGIFLLTLFYSPRYEHKLERHALAQTKKKIRIFFYMKENFNLKNWEMRNSERMKNIIKFDVVKWEFQGQNNTTKLKLRWEMNCKKNEEKCIGNFCKMSDENDYSSSHSYLKLIFLLAKEDVKESTYNAIQLFAQVRDFFFFMKWSRNIFD